MEGELFEFGDDIQKRIPEIPVERRGERLEGREERQREKVKDYVRFVDLNKKRVYDMLKQETCSIKE